MSKFIRINKPHLQNAQHYAMLEAFVTVFTEAGFTAQKLVTLFATLNANFSNEDRYYMLARASEVIARRNAADTTRDKLYTKLYALVRLWRNSGNTAMETAADALVRVFQLYAVNTSAQIDTESGQLDNLITDLSTDQMQAHIQTIGGKWLFDEMKAAHQEVKAIRLEQGTEESEKVSGALLKARKACDEAYDNLITAVEAFATIADDPAPYEAFIKKWNGTLKIYQDMLDRKTGSSTGSGTNNGGSGSGDNPSGTGTDTPGTDTPGTDTPGTDTPGTDTPGTDTPGTGGTGTITPGGGDNPGGMDEN